MADQYYNYSNLPDIPATPDIPTTPVTPATPATPTTSQIPSQFRPIGAWGYFGYTLLFSIPCIGFILLLVFALGGANNINLRNYARSYFCALLVGLIIFFIVWLVTLIFFGGLTAFLSSYAAEMFIPW